MNEFSIATPGNKQIYSRAFVSHNGLNTGDGTWHCSKDRFHQCLHIHRAQNKLQQLLKRDPTVLHERDVSDIPDGTSTKSPTKHSDTNRHRRDNSRCCPRKAGKTEHIISSYSAPSMGISPYRSTPLRTSSPTDNRTNVP